MVNLFSRFPFTRYHPRKHSFFLKRSSFFIALAENLVTKITLITGWKCSSQCWNVPMLLVVERCQILLQLAHPHSSGIQLHHLLRHNHFTSQKLQEKWNCKAATIATFNSKKKGKKNLQPKATLLHPIYGDAFCFHTHTLLNQHNFLSLDTALSTSKMQCNMQKANS